jgi:hypothetical protein
MKVKKCQTGNSLTFLQPNNSKLPSTTRIPYKNMRSSEVASSFGVGDRDLTYLLPTFKYGRMLDKPIEEFNKTKEHLGGPFTSWQEADEWDMNVRHPFVEKGLPIPIPYRTWGKNLLESGKLISKHQTGSKIYGKDDVFALRDTLSTYGMPLGAGYIYPKLKVSDDIYSPSQKAIGDWLKARKETGKFENQLGDNKLDRQLLNLASSETVKDRYEFASRAAQSTIKKHKLPDDMKTFSTFFDKELGDISNAAGVYSPSLHIQFAEQGPQFNRGTNQRHESTHALNAQPQRILIKNILLDKKNKDEYYDKATEVYSRMMQMRLDNNFDPNKIWKKEDMEYLKELNDKNNYNLTNRYTEEEFLELLNEIAQNKTSQTQDNFPMAKKGGLVPRHQTGSAIVNEGIRKYDPQAEAERRKNEWYKNASGKLEEPPINVEDIATLGGALGAKVLSKALPMFGKTIGEDAIKYITKSSTPRFKPNSDYLARLQSAVGKESKSVSIPLESEHVQGWANKVPQGITTILGSPIPGAHHFNNFKIDSNILNAINNINRNNINKNLKKVSIKTGLFPSLENTKQYPLSSTIGKINGIKVYPHNFSTISKENSYIPITRQLKFPPIVEEYPIIDENVTSSIVGNAAIKPHELKKVLNNMIPNDDGSFVRGSYIEGDKIYLDKVKGEFEPPLVKATTEAYLGKDNITPVLQTIKYNKVDPRTGFIRYTGNVQLQNKAPGKFLYDSNYDGLTQDAIDQAKEALRYGENKGLKFDFKGANNSLYDEEANKFNFIDMSTVDGKITNSEDAIEGFRKKLRKGIAASNHLNTWIGELDKYLLDKNLTISTLGTSILGTGALKSYLNKNK